MHVLWLLKGLWTYRTDIALALRLIAALRKSAQEITREYIRKRVEMKLKRQLVVVGFQVALLIVAGMSESDMFASAVLWAVTLYNVGQLVFSTIPELRALRKTLKSKVGYAVKYVLEVSLVAELMQLNVIFLAVCLGLAISSRTWVGASFSYTKPWAKLIAEKPEPVKRARPR